MSKVVILGSSNAISSTGHENTHLAVVGEERMVLIDCSGNPLLRLEQAGLDINSLTDIILTHFHPDHVSALPILLMDLWLMGRKTALNLYGLHHTLDRAEDMMGLFSWSAWPDFYPVAFHRLPATEMSIALDCPDFRVFTSPVRHLIPTIGLRFEFPRSQKVFVYSSDTEPCEGVIRLAHGADVLIHEAAGKQIGHSSAEQAAEVAAQAEVGALYLIHYPTGRFAEGDPAQDARKRFQGEVGLATDFMVFDL